MRKRVLEILFFLPVVCLGQPLPPPAATPAEVAAGTDKYKYVSPWSAAQGGLGGTNSSVSAASATNIATTVSQNTVAQQAQQFVTPQQYGAIGDGVADDTTALLSCLAVAKTGAVKSVYVPPGQYRY